MGNIDIREIRMGKWHVPKSSDIFGSGDGNDFFLAMGYFDMLEVKATKTKEGEGPLMQAYTNTYRIASEADLKHSVQEIKAFTNIVDSSGNDVESSADMKRGFTKEEIDKFWKDESLPMYISMVHLDLEHCLDDIIRKICKIFKGRNYLYYITFDYSGIIVLAKNDTVKEYARKLLKLNYFCQNEMRIQDTFSVFSFNKRSLKTLFDKYAQKGNGKKDIKDEDKDKGEDKYLISVNISVKDLGLYQKFKKKLKKFEKKRNYSSKKTWILGRHDVSIVIDKGDIYWLTYVQYLLDKYSSEKKAFWTYESFVKIKVKERDYKTDQTQDQKEDASWEKANESLEEVYRKFCNNIERLRYDTYLVPVREVKNSIYAILKNGFAEDFIICMYQSFVEFLKYLTDKMKEELTNENPQIRYREKFENCFSEYFSSLNSLVNSAMHSDRQFIQATAFNAIIYDVPPKIMAFYVAMVNKIQNIVRTEDDQEYTFVLAPGFSDEITVKIISYMEPEPPTDRILKVSISERSLYNPKTVICRMTHEIAHYVGDGCRKRDKRKAYMLKTLIYSVLIHILDRDFPIDGEFYALLDRIDRIAGKNQEFDTETMNYSVYLSSLHVSVLEFFIKDREVADEIRNYIKNKIEKIIKTNYIRKVVNMERDSGGIYCPENLSEIVSDFDREYLSSLIYKDIQKKLQRIKRDVETDSQDSEFNMNDFMRTLISLYSETYADLQMILLLDISYDNYLQEFIQDEELDIERIEDSDEDLVRIAVISKLMQDVGLWTELTMEDVRAKKLNQKIRNRQNAIYGIAKFDKEIEEMVDALYNNTSKLWERKEKKVKFSQEQNDVVYMDTRLYSYLYKCLITSAEHYKEEGYIAEIKDLRRVVEIMQKFKDIQEVYETVSDVIFKYKKELNREKNGDSLEKS